MEDNVEAEEEEMAEDLQKVVTLESAQKDKQTAFLMFKGIVATAVLMIILIGGYYTCHWGKSANGDNINSLEQQAEKYLGKDQLYIEEVTRKGNYLAALCTENDGTWHMCVYERDNLFKNRWYASGSLNRLKQGKISSWNYGSPQGEAVLIFCGANISDDVNWYTFQNDKIIYTCPVEDNIVLDIYIISDSSDISSVPTMLDAEQQPLK